MEEYDSVHTEKERKEGGKAERAAGGGVGWGEEYVCLHKPLYL